jgi:hypothetical protein
LPFEILRKVSDSDIVNNDGVYFPEGIRSMSNRQLAPWTALGFSLLVGCTGPSPGATTTTTTAAESLEAELSTPAVGLAIEIENGVGKPLQVRAGQRFYIEQIDLRAYVDTNTDDGLASLIASPVAGNLAWGTPRAVDEEPVLFPNPDNTFTVRRYYRGSPWMQLPTWFIVEQLDAAGRVVAPPAFAGTGLDGVMTPFDDFFIRRLHAIQSLNNCPAPNNCTGATSFQEEALVELRNAIGPKRTFTIAASTTQLRVRWTADWTRPAIIPVTQVASPPYNYGFHIDVAALTPPAADGTYAPGQAITFQMTLKDGSGNRLHPPGVLPSYFEAGVLGVNPAGINYYRAFFDPTTTYYRRKHRERNFTAEILGPLHKVQPIRSILQVPQFFAPTQVVALPERDGVYSEAVIFPQAKIFQGAFDPTHAAWFEPGSDTWTFHLPENAEPGTYVVTVKARRTYLGEDIPRTTTIELQVGSPTPTSATLATGNCSTCHTGGGSLSNILHANPNRATCSGCHAPLAIELEGPVYVRSHFIHSRSGRVDASVARCATCHLTQASIQRTSKSACLSCHKSYPDSHVQQFGPVTSMYVGDYFNPEGSFQQCTTSCHRNHPGSDL